jgi:hypothetical protein
MMIIKLNGSKVIMIRTKKISSICLQTIALSKTNFKVGPGEITTFSSQSLLEIWDASIIFLALLTVHPADGN